MVFVSFYYVLCILLLFPGIFAVGRDEIQFRIKMADKERKVFRCDTQKNYQIRIEDYKKSNKGQVLLNCYLGAQRSTTFNLCAENGSMVSKIFKLERYMSSIWKCSLDGRQLIWIVHIVGSKQVQTFVNDTPIKIVPDDTAQTDGIAEYNYCEGETVHYYCYSQDTGYLRLVYYDDKGVKQFETGHFYRNATTLEFYNMPSFVSTLRSKHHNSYIDCIYTETNENDSDNYIYSTYFRWKNCMSDNEPLQLSVNGVKLVPTQTQSQTDNLFVYKYNFVYSENLNVTCKYMFEDNAKLNLTFGSHSNATIFGKTVSITTGEILKPAVVHCIAYNNDGVIAKAQLKLLSSLLNKDVRIFGLLPHRVEYQYRRDIYTWYQIYRAHVGEELHLTCITFNDVIGTNTPYLKWMVNGDYVSARSTLIHSSSRQMFGNFVFKDIFDENKIVCATQNRTPIYQAVIVLRQAEASEPNYVEVDNPANWSFTGTTVKYGDNANSSFIDEPSKVSIGWILALAAVFCIIIAVSVAIYIIKRRKRCIQNNLIGEKEDKSNQSNPISLNVEQTPNTDHEHFNDDAVLYSVPMKRQNVKSKSNQKLPQGSELVYAELDLTTKTNNIPKTEDPNYSELMNYNIIRDGNDSEYGNVFNNSMYVNANK